MNKKKAALLLHDRFEKGTSYRTLSERYGVSVGTAHRMVKKLEKTKQRSAPEQPQSIPMPDDVKVLKEELRRARLKIELLDAVIDIASEELGVDIRKKSGTRQS